MFTPAKDVNGTFDIPYTAFNEEFGEVLGEITIVIEPIDDAPIAVADQFVTAFETSRVILVDDLTRNDSDGDPELDQPLEITGVQGDNVIFDGAAITFMPAVGFVGDATFTYTLSDPSKQTSTAFVTVSVEAPDIPPAPPLAVDDVYTIAEDNTLAVYASLGVLANDSDPNEDVLSVSLFDGASKGTVDLRSDGSFSYTPFQDTNGEDRFTYEVSDGTNTDLAVAVINIEPVNDAPIALNLLRDQVIDEDESFRFEVPQNTFFDVDGDNLELTASFSDRGSLPDWIVLKREDNSFSGQPPQDVNGTVEITVTVSDGQRNAQSTFLLIVSPVNDAPVVAVPAADQQSDEDEDFKFQLAPNTFSDVDGDQLSYTATLADGSALPSWITFDAEAQEFRGRPPQDSTARSTLKSRHSMGSTALTRLSRLW